MSAFDPKFLRQAIKAWMIRVNPFGAVTATNIQDALEQVVDRSTHTGTQVRATISDFAHDHTTADGSGVLTNDEHDGFVELATSATPSTPVAGKMRLYAQDAAGTARLRAVHSSGSDLAFFRDSVVRVKNISGVAVTKGEVVYITGATGNFPTIAKAIANDADTMPCSGMVLADAANNAFTTIQFTGEMTGLNTSAFLEGARVYVSPTVAGGLTATEPLYPFLSQQIGTITKANAGSGSIQLFVSLQHEGDDSGSNRNTFSIGDGAAGAKVLAFVNAFIGSLSWTPTANRTLTLPDETGTIATRNANTFTDAQLITVNSASNALEIRQIGAGNALYIEDAANPDSTPVVVDSSGRLILGDDVTDASGALFQVNGDVSFNSDTPGAQTASLRVVHTNGSSVALSAVALVAGGVIQDFNPTVTDGLSSITFRYFRASNTTGAVSMDVYFADGSANLQHRLSAKTHSRLVAQSGNLMVGTGASNADRLLQVEREDASTNAVVYQLRLTETTSGTPANGLGVGMEFEVETAAGNNEVGATIEAVITDVTAASEDFDLIFKTMTNGAAASEQMRLSGSGSTITSDTTVRLKTILASLDITAATYDGVSFSYIAQETNAGYIGFSSDGRKMFVMGSIGDDINYYDLSTAWVVSTAVFNSLKSIAGQDLVPAGGFFRRDGKKFYMLGQTNITIFEYDLSVAWDISTLTYSTKSFLVSGKEILPTGLCISPDGLNAYVVGTNSDMVHRYILGTAWDISTAVFSSSTVVLAEGSMQDIQFSRDGGVMLLLGSSADDVYSYRLIIPWDISTAVLKAQFALDSQGLGPAGLYLREDLRKFYTSDLGSDTVYQYSLPELTFELQGNIKTTALSLTEGCNSRMGVATLVAGAVIVANTSVTANTRIFLSVDTIGVLANLGTPYEDKPSRVAGTSFTIKSGNILDTSIISWLLIEPI